MNKARWPWVALIFVVAVTPLLIHLCTPAGIKWVIAARFPSVSWLDAGTLARWMGDDSTKSPVLVDVRSEEEYAVSHLRDALRVDPKQPDLESLPLNDDARIVVYCSVGYRSAALVEEIREAGVGEVYNLTGGIFGWANEGRPLFRQGSRVQAVHPYDQAWAWLVREELRSYYTE